MLRLAFILHLFIGSTLAGVGVIAVLVAGTSAPLLILAVAAIGFVLAFPVTWMVARRLYEA
jgi:hypothetical protein